jgi:hypothetical protein
MAAVYFTNKQKPFRHVEKRNTWGKNIQSVKGMENTDVPQ